MPEAKRGLIINVNTRLPFLREDEIQLPDIADNGFGDNWRLAAQFLTELASAQIESYPHYDKLETFTDQPAWTKAHLLEELKASHPIDIIPRLLVIEPMVFLSNLTSAQLDVVQQALQHLQNRSKTLTAELLIQGLSLGRQTAK